MNLTEVSNTELLGRLEKLAQSERKITHLILMHINEMEGRRLYAELGYDSMFRYLTRHLKYSDDAAYRRLSAARLLKQAPEISEKIENGSLTLTQLTQVQSAIRMESKIAISQGLSASASLPQILEKIENKSTYETKSCLAHEFNLPIREIETLTPQRDESVRFEITLTAEQMKTLESARDLMSHILPDGNWADFLTLLAEKQIKQIINKDSRRTKPTQSFMVTQKRQHIKVSTKAELLLKADYCCEFIGTGGKKCNSKYQLQIDHIQPVALGGKNEKANLRVLCRTHNLAAAEKLGLKMH
ncbi:HNH endonuclease [Bdellovibrio sp. HCB274]|uniref:HNH endonuclease n=1 Tax=Bdellovibrio sp. HCB274 TaxID=3394361 RepID=UPI0039B428D1